MGDYQLQSRFHVRRNQAEHRAHRYAWVEMLKTSIQQRTPSSRIILTKGKPQELPQRGGQAFSSDQGHSAIGLFIQTIETMLLSSIKHFERFGLIAIRLTHAHLHQQRISQFHIANATDCFPSLDPERVSGIPGSLSVEVFLHFRFGERYLSAVRVLLVYCMLPLILSFATFVAFVMQLDVRSSSLVPSFAGAFLLLVFVHTVFIHLRNRAGLRWHSQSNGLSYLFLVVPERVARTGPVELLLEPLACVALGFCC